MAISAVLLERLGALVHQSVRDDAARYGLQPIHLQVLQYLAQANKYSDMPIAIAEYFGITRGTVSQTLAVLQRKDLVSKLADAAHGRRVHVRLTSTGEALLRDSWAQRVSTALDSQDSPEAVEEVLRSVLTILQRLNGQQAFGLCRQCAYFRGDGDGAYCGLTREPLEVEQTNKLCREWAAKDED